MFTAKLFIQSGMYEFKHFIKMVVFVLTIHVNFVQNRQ